MATSNPNHYMQSEGCGVSGNDNDIEMDSNPAYAGVEFTRDEGEGVARVHTTVSAHTVYVLLFREYCCMVKLMTVLLIKMQT